MMRIKFLIKKLAAQTDNIDLILGGHIPYFLPEPQSLPIKVAKTFW